MLKLDHRRKYYLVLDCETATLPCAMEYTGKARQTISIAKPLIYDLGWTIVDRQGNIYDKKNYLISEIFSVPAIFDTAYYADKRPIYMDLLGNEEITLTDWRSATAELEEALAEVEAVGAYNSMFDFKKAIPFTELYINKLYSTDFHKWYNFQTEICHNIASGKTHKTEREFEPECFRFRNKSYPLFDLWGMSCKHLLNNDEYKQMCIDNEWTTPSGKYFKTSAETTYRYIHKNEDFSESHTALDDATIESEILGAIIKKNLKNLEIGLTYFPFRILGTVDSFQI